MIAFDFDMFGLQLLGGKLLNQSDTDHSSKPILVFEGDRHLCLKRGVHHSGYTSGSDSHQQASVDSCGDIALGAEVLFKIFNTQSNTSIHQTEQTTNPYQDHI